jgi:hypothetical protein
VKRKSYEVRRYTVLRLLQLWYFKSRSSGLWYCVVILCGRIPVWTSETFVFYNTTLLHKLEVLDFKLFFMVRSCQPFAQHQRYKITPCRLYATAYSTYSQLSIISGAGTAQCYSTGLRAGWSGVRVAAEAGHSFSFTRPALGPTQPPNQWVPEAFSLGVKRPGREADHSAPSRAEVK